MEHDSQPEAHCVHVWIQGIHPMLCGAFSYDPTATEIQKKAA